MSDTTVEFGIVGHEGIGPEDLRIPAEPARLRQAVQRLRELSEGLRSAGTHMVGRDGDHPGRDGSGATATALGQIVRWSGRKLVKDANLLDEIAEVAEREAELLGDIQGEALPRLRHQWQAAQQEFITTIRNISDGHGPEPGFDHGPRREREGGREHRGGEAGATFEERREVPDLQPHRMLRHLDARLARDHEPLFRRLLGRDVLDDGDHGGRGTAILLTPQVEEAEQTYRRTVRPLLEEYADLVAQVRRLEHQIDERVVRPERPERDDERQLLVEGADVISGPREMRHLLQDLRRCGEANEQALQQFGPCVNALEDGRLNERGRPDQRPEYRGEWKDHFERRARRMERVCERVDDVIEQLRRIDDQCARAIRGI